MALHPIDLMDMGSGQQLAALTDPNLTTITPVNKPHPRLDLIVSGSSRSLYAWRPTRGTVLQTLRDLDLGFRRVSTTPSAAADFPLWVSRGNVNSMPSCARFEVELHLESLAPDLVDTICLGRALKLPMVLCETRAGVVWGAAKLEWLPSKLLLFFCLLVQLDRAVLICFTTVKHCGRHSFLPHCPCWLAETQTEEASLRKANGGSVLPLGSADFVFFNADDEADVNNDSDDEGTGKKKKRAAGTAKTGTATNPKTKGKNKEPPAKKKKS